MTKKQIIMQKECFAVKACHMMNKTADETAKLLYMDVNTVKTIYKMIEKDMIDFN